MKETELLIKYLEQHQEVTDLLFTGGDPMIMSFKVFKSYIEPFLSETNKTNIQTIRIGTKVLGYWPYKFISDPDAEDFLFPVLLLIAPASFLPVCVLLSAFR